MWFHLPPLLNHSFLSLAPSALSSLPNLMYKLPSVLSLSLTFSFSCIFFFFFYFFTFVFRFHHTLPLSVTYLPSFSPSIRLFLHFSTLSFLMVLFSLVSHFFSPFIQSLFPLLFLSFFFVWGKSLTGDSSSDLYRISSLNQTQNTTRGIRLWSVLSVPTRV